MAQVECLGCKTLVWAAHAGVKGHCGACMTKIVAERKARADAAKGIDAAAWFYGQSFTGGVRA